MVAALKATGVDGQLFKRALLGSLSWLAANHEEVNRLNVFPVPDGDTGTNMLLTLQAAAAAGARAAVLKTPSQLQILRDAGVVDAGGFGLQLILEGMLKSVEESEPALAALNESRLPVVAASQVALALPEGGWGYCTEFLIEGNNLDTDLIRGQIESLGNSVLVVGEPELVKVHVHTDDPTSVINLAGGYGKVLKLSVGDMSTQHRRILEAERGAGGARPARPNGAGLVAVVAGRGLVDIFRGLGVDAIIEGGQTMNPSTQDMLTAIESVPYEEVILLPNNGNVIPAAKQVVGLTKKKVHVIETHSVPQGVSAVVAFRPERSGDENMRAMKAEAERVQTIEVTHAVRDTRSNGVKVKKGDVIGLINDKLEIAGDDYSEVVNKALGKLGPDSFELVTVYRGEQASDDELKRLESAIRSSYPGLEVEVQQGGQQHYPFILSVE